MEFCERGRLNYQYWFGTDLPQYGYGAMLEGFKSGLPTDVELNNNASVAVYMYDPSRPHKFAAGQHRVLYTMWETDKLPFTYSRWLDHYDQVLVPCEHNREVFSKYAPNVSVVPLGVNIDYWKPTPRPANSRFRFHAGGSMWLRKGLDVVVKAFEKAGVDAELHIKVPMKRFVPDREWPSNIIIHTGWMSKQEQFNWFNQADCFIGASRGEGFGLMPLQAMAMGIPTIITPTSGQAQFADLASIVVPTKPQRCNVHEIIDFDGFWDEPDVDALVEALRRVCGASDGYKAEALGRVSQVARYSWDKSCRKLLNVLPVGHVLDNPVYEPFMCYIKIRVNGRCEVGVNNDHWDFVPGVDYIVNSGVYDILAKANYIKSFEILKRSSNYAKANEEKEVRHENQKS
jgi:glycosyltransferase involved in cell wall biosynthesis